jgi:cobalamin biosynthesis Mg chelatase CobN
MLKFQNQVKLTTGLDIKTPDWVKEAEKEAAAGTAPGKVKEEAGSKKLEDVKGYEMKEKKDETATELPTSGVSVVAILILLGIVALIGRGLWKGMRRQQ